MHSLRSPNQPEPDTPVKMLMRRGLERESDMRSLQYYSIGIRSVDTLVQ